MVENGSPHAGASRTRLRAVVAAVVLVAAAGGAVVLWGRFAPWHQVRPLSPAVVANPEDDGPDEPAPRDPGYVGPQACAPCHAQRVAEFQKTAHFRACRPARPGDMCPGFAPGKGDFATPNPALHIEMSQSGDDYFQTTIRATPGGERRARAHIDLVYGAGSTDEVFLGWQGDRLYELPTVWLYPQGQWALNSFEANDPNTLAREMTPRCLECHNTWIEHVAGTPNQYKRGHVVLGVTCENCHGPARDHVTFHQAHPEAEGAHAILHPGRLTRDLQMDLCAQCHTNSIRPRGPAFSYRPGEPLNAHFRTLAGKDPEDDHVANQVKYLRQSQCFQKSDALTCVTCHNPHRAKGPTNAGSASCRKCHQPADCGEQPRLPAAVRGDCVGCHMPQRYKIQVNFATEDDQYVPPVKSYEHRIGVYPRGRLEVLLAWYRAQSDAAGRQEADRLSRELVAYWLAEADKCRRDYRFLAAIAARREVERLEPTPTRREQLREAVALQSRLETDWAEGAHELRQRRLPEAIASLERALVVKPDWAKAHGKLGTAYAAAGQKERAVEHLRAVGRCDPDDPYGYNMLGWLAYLDDRSEEAVAYYRQADDLEPFTAEINYRWGLALGKLGRWAEAAERFREVLAVDPNNAPGCAALAQALSRQGRPAEAVPFARRGAKLTHYQDPDVLLGLAEAYADAGRFADADDAAVKAVEAARAGDPRALPQIRLRAETIRGRARQARDGGR